MSTVKQYIDATADAVMREVRKAYLRGHGINYYRATEDLLRAYPKLKAMREHPEEYGFTPIAKSKDISVAPPKGGGTRDPLAVLDEYVDSRAASYDRTVGRFIEVDAAVRTVIARPEFIVIRMLYWGEDVHGQPRPEGSKRWTFEEIQGELASIGIDKNIKTLRTWRTKLVREMTVLLFGAEGAVSIENREPKHDKSEGEEQGPEEDGET